MKRKTKSNTNQKINLQKILKNFKIILSLSLTKIKIYGKI